MVSARSITPSAPSFTHPTTSSPWENIQIGDVKHSSFGKKITANYL